MIPCFDKVKKKKKKENSCGAFKAGASVVNGIFFIYFFFITGPLQTKGM